MIGKNAYVCLKDNWTIRGASKKFVLFDFKGGIFEERFSLSRRVHQILTLADGQHTCSEIKAIAGANPVPYLTYLQKLGAIEVLSTPRTTPRSFPKPYDGRNFLGRIMFHITGRCNQDCKHCYMASQKWNELSFAEIADLIRQARELNVASFSITGGEPFVREDLIDILRELDRNEMKIEGIFTNGTIVLDDFLDQANVLQEMPFFISINGSSPEDHDKFGGSNGSFDKAIETVITLVGRGVKVFGNTSLNVFLEDEEQIRKLYELVKSLGVYRWRVSGPFLEGNWKTNFQAFGISPDKELSIMLVLLQMWLADGRPFEMELGHVFRYIEGKCIRRSYKKGDYVCDYFRDRIVLMPDGGVGACSLLVTPHYLIGNIRQQSLRDIWESDQMRYYKDLKITDIIDARCLSCSQLSECGLGCRANAVLSKGKYEDIDPEICGICMHPLYNKFQEVIQQSGLEIVEE